MDWSFSTSRTATGNTLRDALSFGVSRFFDAAAAGLPDSEPVEALVAALPEGTMPTTGPRSAKSSIFDCTLPVRSGTLED